MKKRFLGLGAIAMVGALALTSCDLVSEKSVSESDAVEQATFAEQLATAEANADKNYDMTKDFKMEANFDISSTASGEEAGYSVKGSYLIAVDYDNKVANVKAELSGNDGSENTNVSMKLSVYIEDGVLYTYTDYNDGESSTSAVASVEVPTVATELSFSAAVNTIMGIAESVTDVVSLDLDGYEELLGDDNSAIKFYVTDGKTFTAKTDNAVLQITYETTSMEMYVKGEADGISASVQVKSDFSDQSVKHY